MTDRLKRAAIPLVLAAASFALALAQRPGATSSDTKVDLHLDPAAFLAAVASPWTDSYGLGAVWSGQYSGYLWPMGPFFALGHAVGLPDWLVQRLWLGLVLALAAWGAVKLMDALHRPERGVAHLVAGAVAVANPYTVVFANRTSITLVAYASLPWLLLCTQRGLRTPRSWWWPAAFALVLASAGGGVNAATIAWVLLGPVLLVLYEVWVIGARPRAVGAFALRAAPLVLVSSAWWVVPTLVQAAYGIDFLRFTEQPAVIWHTSPLTESLRGMGYWTAYTELGFGGMRVPFLTDAGTLLFNPFALIASLSLPALALLGFTLARCHRYAPFLLGLTLAGAFAMMAGFPEGSPLRAAITAIYEHVDAVQFLRTTYKAGPLTMVGIALLVGLGAEHAWEALRTPAGSRSGGGAARVRALLAHPAGRIACATGALALLVGAALPLFEGRAIDRDVDFAVPAAWQRAAADVDRTLPRGTRTVVLPGSLFGFYDWGGVTDPAFPALSDRPTAARFVVPYSDLRAVDLLWAVDGLVEERRTLPGQLRPLLDLMGAGAVISPFDYDARRAGSVPPADAARALVEGGLGRPSGSYGARRARPAASSSLDAPLPLPRLRRYDVRPTGGAGLVRVRPSGPATVIDGSAGGVTALAAFGQLDGRRPLLYAADQEAAGLRRLARAGASIVISDSNRRRAFVNSRIRANTGRTLDAGATIPPDIALLDPFDRGPAAETVAVYSGARYVRGTVEGSFSQFPERGPMAAFDGDARTSWITNAFLRQGERPYVEVGFSHPRDVQTIDVLPYGDRRGRPVEVEIAGSQHALHRGWNRLQVDLHDVDRLRLEISRSAAPPRGGGPGGVRELRIPELHVRERLRTPLVAARALRGESLERSRLTVLAERTTAFSPLRLTPPAGELQDRDLRNRADAETAIERVVALPAARRFKASAWVSAGPRTSDAALDRLAGVGGAGRFESSARFESVPGRRASRAFDGDRRTAWVGAWLPGRAAWVAWRTPRPARVRRLQLAPVPGVRVPTRVRLRWAGAVTPPLPVGRDGTVRLPAPVTAARWRLELLDARFPAGTPAAARRRRAVGIAEIRGAGVPRALSPADGAARSAGAPPRAPTAVDRALRGAGASPRAPGTTDGAPRGAGTPAGPAPLRGTCGDAALTVAGTRIPLRPVGTIADLDAGRPLRARGCRTAAVPAGRALLSTATGPLRVDLLRLDSPAPHPVASTGRGGGRVLGVEEEGRGAVSGARLALDGPAWLVLGESYNRGWRARCDGRDLGAPAPIDGYANGWRVDRCHAARFSFVADGPVRASYWLSLLAAALLLGWLTLRPAPRPGGDRLARGLRGGAGRRPRGARSVGLPEAGAEGAGPRPSEAGPGDARVAPYRSDGVPRLAPIPATLAGGLAAVVLGLLFALRVGVVAGPLVGFVLWRGVGARTLAATAAALLGILVPAIYLIHTPPDLGGFNSNYGIDLIAAHWVGVLAAICAGLAVWRASQALRADRSSGPS